MFNKENNQQIGKIYNYGGFAGEIVTTEETYIFNINDCYNNVQDEDIVSFYSNNLKFGNEQVKVAKFVSKQKQLKKHIDKY